MPTELYPKLKAAKEFLDMTKHMAAKEVKCGVEWLSGTGVLCQNDPHEHGMHWGKYQINYDKCGLVGEGEIWWNSQVKKEGAK